MNVYISGLVEQYKRSGLIVDTNLLLLWFMGLFNPAHISRFKRTQTFTEDDYVLLTDLLKQFKKILTTPHILTEVSNLSAQLGESLQYRYFDTFAANLEQLEEVYIPVINISKTPEFRRFGITDTGIFFLAKGRYLVLTDDFRLSQYLRYQGIDVINFNHIRFSDLL